MKGLERYPQSGDIVSAMNKIQKQSISIEELIEIIPLCRFDVRLAETIVAHFAKNWTSIDPFQMNDRIKHQFWGNCLGVLLENAESYLIEKTEAPAFRRWKSVVMYKIKPASNEFFWIGLDPFAGKRMKLSVENSLKVFTRWGYFGDDPIVNKSYFKVSCRTLLPKMNRIARLKKLAEEKIRFNLHDYLFVLEGKVQKRVAELDLQTAPFLIKSGNTKARTYKLRRRGLGRE